MPAYLPKLIFTDDHHNPLLGRILKKLTSKLNLLGYKSFLDEAPVGRTLQEHLELIEKQDKLTVAFKNKVKEELNLNLDNLDYAELAVSSEHFHHPEKILNELKKHHAHAAFKHFLESLAPNNITYKAVDHNKLANHELTATEIAALTPERDKLFAEAYLTSSHAFFSRVGLAHIDGIQKNLLAHTPDYNKANQEFCFFNIYDQASLKKAGCYQQSICEDRVKLPIKMITINASNKSDDEVVSEIIGHITHKIKMNSAHQRKFELARPGKLAPLKKLYQSKLGTVDSESKFNRAASKSDPGPSIATRLKPLTQRKYLEPLTLSKYPGVFAHSMSNPATPHSADALKPTVNKLPPIRNKSASI